MWRDVYIRSTEFRKSPCDRDVTTEARVSIQNFIFLHLVEMLEAKDGWDTPSAILNKNMKQSPASHSSEGTPPIAPMFRR